MVESKSSELEKLRHKTLSRGCIDTDSFEVDDSFRPGDITPEGVHTTTELVALLESDSKIGFEGIFLAATDLGKKFVRLNKEKFLEAWKKNSTLKPSKKLRESFSRGFDYETGANVIGNDYTPLLGGPFNKQLYLHDSLRMFSLCFFAYHHDPIARALIHVTRDFTLGRGYRIDSKDKGALAVWRAFEKANDLANLMNFLAIELATYGEIFLWWLPNGETKIGWQLSPGQEVPQGIIPRVRLMDPSTIWEIITYPEDITRVIAYQQVFPTQYQIYTAADGGKVVPSSKFIIQQVPAEQVDHIAVNRMSNEKRGRSDLYPSLAYLKRLRDSVQYSVIAMQKASAWSMDTTIDGSPADVDAYVTDQESQPTVPPAGSEFVHSPKIKREYLSNHANGGTGGSVVAFDWCLSMACAGTQIPVSYVDTHLSGGSSKAAALVGTEPVAKKFEMRQGIYEDVIKLMWDRVQAAIGNPGAECEITFPEIIAQDRSAKIKDTITAQEVDVISHQTMSIIVSKELGVTTYDYPTEQAAIVAEKKAKLDSEAILISPLTAKPPGSPGAPPAPVSGSSSSSSNATTSAKPPAAANADATQKPSAVTSADRRAVSMNRG